MSEQADAWRAIDRRMAAAAARHMRCLLPTEPPAGAYSCLCGARCFASLWRPERAHKTALQLDAERAAGAALEAVAAGERCADKPSATR